MTVTVTNMMPSMPVNVGNTTFMFRKRPKHRQDALRRVVVPVFGILLVAGLILWFAMSDAGDTAS